MDEKTLLALIEKFDRSDISELEFSNGSLQLILRKGISSGIPVAMGTPADAEGPHSAQASPSVHLVMKGKADGANNVEGSEEITSPIVGTFYRASGPDSKPFVEPGQKVKAGDTLCILEAMKMMNHLEAEFDCEILAISAANGDLVEYGQTLFEVRRT